MTSPYLILLKSPQTLIVPAQKLSIKPLHIVPLRHSQPRHNIPWLLGLQQTTILLQSTELSPVFLAHTLVVHFADLSLHLRVHDTGADRDSSDRRFFNGERKGKVVQHGFTRAVAAPALVGGCCGARGGKEDCAGGFAQGGEGGLYLDRAGG